MSKVTINELHEVVAKMHKKERVYAQLNKIYALSPKDIIEEKLIGEMVGEILDLHRIGVSLGSLLAKHAILSFDRLAELTGEKVEFFQELGEMIEETPSVDLNQFK